MTRARELLAKAASRMDRGSKDSIEAYVLGIEGLLGHSWDQLAKAREEIDQLKARITELEAAPERAPVPGADIPGEVVEATAPRDTAIHIHDVGIDWEALADLLASDTPTDKDVRAALAAADAKRTELDGGKARMDTAGEWVQRIDREKAKIIGWVAYRSGGDLDDVVDAVLAALPDLMKGEER